ncbi:hypothetical protein [Methanogenium cariaci]|uniref:hypothetical protein n=1 Tax=Methanogenium cariaci TaxID=2197 RepID=UPI0012F70779|nr:hypothetical protein [Methanogenium cariaci]
MKEPLQRKEDSGETGAHVENKSAPVPVAQIGLIFIGLFGVMLMFYMVPTKLPYLLQEAGITSTLLYGVLLGIPGFVQVFSALSSSRLNTIFSKGGARIIRLLMYGSRLSHHRRCFGTNSSGRRSGTDRNRYGGWSLPCSLAGSVK